ncbi:uncharacterized protein N7482_004010 [Penicillium canariense]|uniref:Mitochondrial substrate carrier n=1 Tax=Penicillium canariense TaxID=189055 RepID=A0A9W9LPP9_9EURO|nr:uncharacterized protein N7482_004010 [Penicillium canariense]KAJ5168416.1 hypothetical protein N7482_004010 [Penicillium canariense]
MAEFKLSYESQLVSEANAMPFNPSVLTRTLYRQDAFHPSFRWESRDPRDDWKTAALRGPALPVLGNAVAGAVGSAISNVIVYPLNVIVARLQTQAKKDKSKEGSDDESDDESEYTDILDAARKIYEQQGLVGFYPGLAQDTWKSVADSFLFFLAYNTIRQRRIVARVGPAKAKSKNIVLPIWDELAVGMVAGAFSKLFTTPLSNIVARKQTAARKGAQGGKDASTADIASQIRAEKGLGGFWSGYSASLILTLNPSITFFLNEVLKYALLPRARRAALTCGDVFLGGSEQINGVIHHVSVLPGKDPGTALKGFFSHGFTMLAKDAVYATIVKAYYLLLIVMRRYPSPDELLARAREQAEEYSEIAREGARDLVERAREAADDALKNHSGGVAVDMTSSAVAAGAAATKSGSAGHGIDASSGLKVPHAHDEINETAELVGDYVEEEAAEWKSFYHWFWDKERMKG